MHLYSNEHAKVRGALLFWVGLQLSPSGHPTQNNRQRTRVTMCLKTVRPYVTCCSAGLQLTLLQDPHQAAYQVVVPLAINIAAYVRGVMTVNTPLHSLGHIPADLCRSQTCLCGRMLSSGTS